MGSKECTGGECMQQPALGNINDPADVNDDVMVITAIKVTREVHVTNRSVQYHHGKAIVTLRTASGSVVANATFTGTWASPGEIAPTAAAALSADTRRSGQAVFWSQAWKAAGEAGRCELTVRNVQFTGKSYDRSASVTSSAINWD
jgi:hypothetical protein